LDVAENIGETVIAVRGNRGVGIDEEDDVVVEVIPCAELVVEVCVPPMKRVGVVVGSLVSSEKGALLGVGSGGSSATCLT
jgi:hypothetical protein